MNTSHAKHGLQCGMTLVEVLVASVIMAVGLLGVMALQTASLRDSYSSLLRSQATSMADDILDRMRANRNEALNGDYNTAVGSMPADVTTQAGIDVSRWKSLLASTMPRTPNGSSADGAIVVAAGNVVTVTIRWGERDAPAALQFQTSTEL